MKYLINSNIEFDTTTYILKSLISSDLSIKLSNASGRILEELIKHHEQGSLVTREYLFNVIWKDYGLTPSNGNLNQQISLIRKTLTTLGLKASLIITIPKRGLKINHQLTIKKLENDLITTQPNYTKNNTNNHYTTTPSIITLGFKNYIKYMITLTTTLVIIFSLSFLYLQSKTDHIKLYCCKEINACNICASPTISDSDYYDYNIPYFEII